MHGRYMTLLCVVGVLGVWEGEESESPGRPMRRGPGGGHRCAKPNGENLDLCDEGISVELG